MYSVVGTDGQVYGPVEIDTLKDWVGQGRLDAKTNLIDPIDGRVFSADVVPELRSLFFVAPPIIPKPGVAPHPVTYSPGDAYAAGNAQAAPMPAAPPPPLVYGVPPAPSAPIQQAAAFQQGAPGAPSVQVNNYIALNNQTAVVAAAVAPSPKSKTTAILLCIFLGGLGIHRFYLGHKNTGIAMLLISLLSVGYLSIVTGIWALVDLIMICNGSLLDSDNRALT